MKQKLFKKGWALICLILCVGIGAWAVDSDEGTTDAVVTVDGEPYQTLESAVKAINASGATTPTLVMQKDVKNLTAPLGITHSVVIDLNGKTISNEDNAATFNEYAIISSYPKSHIDITVKSSKEGGAIRGKVDYDNGKQLSVVAIGNGTLNLESGVTISAEVSENSSFGPRAVAIYSHNCEVNMNGANLSAKGGKTAVGIASAFTNNDKNPNATDFSKIYFHSGTITIDNPKAYGHGIDGNATLEMTDGNIEVNGAQQTYGIYFPISNSQQATHNIKGGTIKVSATENPTWGGEASYDVLYGPAVISGGKFFITGVSKTPVTALKTNNRNATAITVKGGYFNEPIDEKFIDKECRQVAVANGSSEYGEGLRYTIERSKFHVDVTGYDPTAEDDGYRAPHAVSANVFKDYSFNVSMPVKGESTVGADKADVNISMTGVQTLGLKEGEIRRYSKTVETGVPGISADLTKFLSNVYGFGGATIPVTVKAQDKSYSFDYQIGAYDESKHSITGTPSDENKARAAWHLLTSKVSATQDYTTNDTHLLFKRGAYILIGDEKLVFDQDYDFLKGNANLSTLFSDVRPYVHVEKSGLSGQAANKAVVYMPEGSTLGISSSSAALTEDAFLTVDATDKADLNITGMLSGLRDQLLKSGENSTKLAIAYAVGMFNEVIGLVDEADNVPVTLEFKKNKFHLDVTGYSSDDEKAVPVTVNADVYSDYSFDVALPAPGSDQLTASKATVNIRMTDVSTLGVKGTRSYSKTVETGVSSVSAALSSALKNTYAFQGASCPVTIKADGQEKSFTYNIAGIKDYHIVGTPSKSEDAQAAWALMTSKVTTQSGVTPEDTHFLFKKGAYLQIGDERLVFLKDFDFLAGAASMDKLFDGAQVKIQKVNIKDAQTVKATAYLPAGSTLGVSSSAASVSEDVYVTMDAIDKAGSTTVTGFFSNLKTQFSGMTSDKSKAYVAIYLLVNYFDGIIGQVDQLNGVNFTVEFKKPENKPVKFHLDVTGYDATTDDPIAVNADVYNDYSFKVSLPDALNDNLSASKATVNISMTGVQSLGLKEGETRNYSKTLETGVTGISAKLSDALKNTYAFQGVKCPVTIKDENDTKSFDYTIAGINEDYQIVGTPSSTEAARAAWKLMTSHVKATQDLSTNDTHFLFKKGAYLQIGDEKLVFDADYDFLKGSANLDELFSGVRPYVRVVKNDGAVKTASVYLPAGSTLGVSSSAASIDEDVKVTMDVSKSTVDESNFKGLLSGYRDMIYNGDGANKRTAIALLVYYFDQVIGVADGAEEVPFTVEFTKAETPKFHLDVTGYSSDEANASEVPVNADVYGDYHFVVSLPAPDLANLVASKATVNIAMTGVQTLGLKEGETRSYSKTVNTGVPGVNVNLVDFLTKTYAFNGATCPVTVKDENGSDEFDYQIAGINDMYQIIGTPVTADGTNGTEAARAAWHRLTSHVKAQGGVTPEDTHFLFKKGAFLQIGDERIVFLDDFDFLKGAASMETLFDGANVRIEKVNKTADATAVVYLPEGSTLGVSNSSAAIDEDVYVTMDGNNTGTQLSDVFSSMASGSNLNSKAAILFLVQSFDAVVGAVDEANGVSFTVEFKKNVAKTTKFHVDVTGYDYDDLQKGVDTPITVAADVYSDYSFLVSLPDILNDNLSASKATLNVWMENVESLGVGQKRQYSKTIETGVNMRAKLSTFLKNTYKFNGVTAPVTIKDGDEEHSFTYNIAAIDSAYHIIGTPSSEADARAAWKFMVNDKHLATQSGVTPEDSHFLFKKGSYIQIGNQKLVFTADFDFLKGGVKQDATLADLFASAQVETQAATEGSNDLAEVYLTAGSTLGLSSSAATVKKNVTISMRGAEIGGNGDDVNDFFSTLKNAGNLDAKTAIGGLVYVFDAVIGAVDNAEKVAFTVEFTQGDVQYIDWTTNNDNGINDNKDDWQTMYTDANNAYNIDGDNLYAFKVTADQPNVNINFTRKFTAGAWAAWVAPFDMTLTDDILENYEFGYIEGITTNGKEVDKDDLGKYKASFGVKLLKAGQTVKANMPYVVMPKVTGSKTFTVENTTLKKTNDPNLEQSWTAFAYNYILKGVYETKYSEAGELWYALLATGSFKKAASDAWLKPFRFFLTLTDNDNNPYEIKAGALRLTILDEATGINSIKTDGNGEMRIYDLQGRRVYNPTQKGVYIVNGRKVVMGR